jgi:ADP-ribose pyrophosphatase
MLPRSTADVTDIEVVEDFSATARCDEGFLQVRRLRCHNRRADGSHSKV